MTVQSPAPTTQRARRSHHDAPDTDADFRRLRAMTEGPGKERLSQDLVRAWLPMAHRLALRFRNRGESLEDLQQVAALGLVKAVSRYDPDRGSAFESFAVPTVVGEIKRHFRDHLWDLHVPRRVQELRNRVRTAIRELTLAPGAGGSPTVARVAAHCGLSEEEVLDGLEALESYRTLSLDAQLTGAEDGYSLADTLGATEPGFEHVVHREAVKPELSKLPERERRILYLRFFCGMTQSRIAEELGISQMHVSRLLNRTFTAIRQGVESNERHEPHARTSAA
ncbi:SigB/SigF/SigG family RNA polymerase sigma factor [Streptomyces sparsus]